MSLHAEARSGVRWTAFAAGGQIIAQLLQLVVVARVLRPEDFGLMGMVVVVLGLTQAYADVGISAAIVYHQGLSRAQLSSLYWLNMLVGALLFGALWLAAPLASALFHEPRLVPLVQVTGIVFLIQPIGRQFEAILQRDLRFDVLARQDLFGAASGAVAAIAGALGGLGVWALVLGTLVTAVARAVLVASEGLRLHRPALHFRWSDVRGLVGFGLYQMGERTISYIGQRLDQFLVGSMLGAEALGFYSFALNLISQPVNRINPVVTKVAFPLFCRVQDEPVRLRRGFVKMLELVTAINAPLLLGLAAVAPWFIVVVFGAKWAAAIPLVQVLALVGLGRCIGNLKGSLLLARGRVDLGFWWNVLLLALNVPALVVGVRYGGALGVAVMLLATQVVLGALGYPVLVRPTAGDCGREYLGAVATPLALALMATLPMYLLGSLVPWNDAAVLAIQIAGAVLVYLVALRALTPGLYAELRRFLPGGSGTGRAMIAPTSAEL
ncbi:MAG TPA: MOP flippase family protein [Gemmatimonadales bacterium]|nr:MOP flippase family protein [Gemmatimonadales bacterium]